MKLTGISSAIIRFRMEIIMYDELTEQDIKKMEEEIEYRKLVVRKQALEAVKEARAVKSCQKF